MFICLCPVSISVTVLASRGTIRHHLQKQHCEILSNIAHMSDLAASHLRPGHGAAAVVGLEDGDGARAAAGHACGAATRDGGLLQPCGGTNE